MAAKQATKDVRRRYARIASIYDVANLERPLYAAARKRAVDMLELRPGARVLDVACGTGANFALIEERIGPSGELTGVDLTPQMLARARARVARHDWANVRLRECDITAMSDSPFDAAICTLGLSVIPDWRRAWEAMHTLVRPGGRIAVMDAGFPDPSPQRAMVRPLAWLLSRLFAADCERRPWRMLERATADPVVETFTFGWVTAAAGAKTR